jgi:hypothetical protein
VRGVHADRDRDLVQTMRALPVVVGISLEDELLARRVRGDVVRPRRRDDVDSTGYDDRSWLDTQGHEHSPKLHLTETFEKTAADNIHYTVKFDDPVFFTRPWTSVRDFKRQNTRIMSYSCEENEKDRIHLQLKVN